jgi:hypothetical protein
MWLHLRGDTGCGGAIYSHRKTSRSRLQAIEELNRKHRWSGEILSSAPGLVCIRGHVYNSVSGAA